jgi:hypothetical protein
VKFTKWLIAPEWWSQPYDLSFVQAVQDWGFSSSTRILEKLKSVDQALMYAQIPTGVGHDELFMKRGPVPCTRYEFFWSLDSQEARIRTLIDDAIEYAKMPVISETPATSEVRATPEVPASPEVRATPEVPASPEVGTTPELWASPNMRASPKVRPAPKTAKLNTPAVRPVDMTFGQSPITLRLTVFRVAKTQNFFMLTWLEHPECQTVGYNLDVVYRKWASSVVESGQLAGGSEAFIPKLPPFEFVG